MWRIIYLLSKLVLSLFSEFIYVIWREKYFVFVLFFPVVSTNCLSSKDYPIASLKTMYPCKWVVNIQPVTTGLIIWWYYYAISKDAISGKGEFCCRLLWIELHRLLRYQAPDMLHFGCTIGYIFWVFIIYGNWEMSVWRVVFGKAQIRVNSL